LTEDKQELDRQLFNKIDLNSLKNSVELGVTQALTRILQKLSNEFSQFALVKPSSKSFLNENVLNVIDTGTEKLWNNHTGSMVNIRSENIISEGIHVLRLQSINDEGGYTVIGISEAEQSDYYNCIGLAGNKFKTNHKTKNIGSWSNSLQWGIGDILELVVDVPNLQFTFTNETKNNLINET